jgi:SAM-dependent methyltransferase
MANHHLVAGITLFLGSSAVSYALNRVARSRPLLSLVRALSSSSAGPADNAPDVDFFRDKVYKDAVAAGKTVPWDVKTHQPALERKASVFRGKVLDVGCGTGDNARWLATLPAVDAVTAVDFSPEAISICKARGVHPKLTFSIVDVMTLRTKEPGMKAAYDVLLDSAVFHCIGDDAKQKLYLHEVTSCVKVGGKLVLLVFSDHNEDPWVGPRRISAAHARAMWTEAGWRVDTLDLDCRYMDSIGRPGGGGMALLMEATRVV